MMEKSTRMRITGHIIFLCVLLLGVAVAQTVPEPGKVTEATAKPVDVHLINQGAPLRVQNADEGGWFQPSIVIAVASFLIAGLAYLFSLSQWKKQYQTAQMETCERLFDDLRRTELAFITPIDAEYIKNPSSWNRQMLRKQNKTIDHAAWDYFRLWDYLAFLVLQKRIDDTVMTVLIKRKLIYAYDQLRLYAPEWISTTDFPYFKELHNKYSPTPSQSTTPKP